MANSRPYQTTDAVTLAPSGSATSKKVNVLGAKRVHIAVSANGTDQLTTGTINLHMSDGKTVTVTPAVLPGGTDSVIVELNCAGVITAVDLSAAGNHRALIVRALAGSGTSGPYAMDQPLTGLQSVSVNLARGAGGGTTTYTLFYTVYFDGYN